MEGCYSGPEGRRRRGLLCYQGARSLVSVVEGRSNDTLCCSVNPRPRPAPRRKRRSSSRSKRALTDRIGVVAVVAVVETEAIGEVVQAVDVVETVVAADRGVIPLTPQSSTWTTKRLSPLCHKPHQKPYHCNMGTYLHVAHCCISSSASSSLHIYTPFVAFPLLPFRVAHLEFSHCLTLTSLPPQE